jgi:hypothetical protein
MKFLITSIFFHELMVEDLHSSSFVTYTVTCSMQDLWLCSDLSSTNCRFCIFRGSIFVAVKWQALCCRCCTDATVISCFTKSDLDKSCLFFENHHINFESPACFWRSPYAIFRVLLLSLPPQRFSLLLCLIIGNYSTVLLWPAMG